MFTGHYAAENTHSEVPIYVRILGPIAVGSDEFDLQAVEGPVQRAVLARLALNAGRFVGAGSLVDEVWPDTPVERGRNSLQVAVGKLRRLLGPDALRTEPNGYRLSSAVLRVDLDEVRSLVGEAQQAWGDGVPTAARAAASAALDRYVGDVMSEISTATADSAREQALLLRQHAVLLSAQASLELQDPHAAIALIRAELPTFPFDEDLHAVLFRALQRAGRASEALFAYDALRRRLAEELGSDPSPKLQAVFSALMDPEPDPVSLVSHERPRANKWDPLPEPATPTFGRVEELSRVVGLLQSGHRLVTLVGTGGIGKTRLATEIARTYATATQAPAVLVPLMTAAGDAEVVRVMVAACRGEGEDFTAALRGTRAVVVLDNAEHVRGAVAALVRDLLQVDGLTMMVTSRRALGLSDERVVTVGPLESDDPSSPTMALLVDRAGLTATDTAAAEGSLTALARRSAGVPLVVELLASALKWSPPENLLKNFEVFVTRTTDASSDRPTRHLSVGAVVHWSVGSLSAPAREALGVLSLCRGQFTLDLALEMLSPTFSQSARKLVVELVDASLIHRLVGTGPVQLQVLEPIRLAVRTSPMVPKPTRKQRRSYTQAFLDLLPLADDDAHNPEHALMLLVRTHEPDLLHALRWAWRNDKNLVWPSLPALLVAWFYLDRHADVEKWAARALADPGVPALARLYLQMTQLILATWRDDMNLSALALLDGVRAQEGMLRPEWRLRLAIASAYAYASQRDFDLANDALVRAVPSRPRDHARLALSRSLILLAQGRHVEVIATCRRVLASHTLSTEPAQEISVRNALGYSLLQLGETSSAEGELRQARTIARHQGLVALEAMVSLNEAWVSILQEQPTRALATVAETETLLGQDSWDPVFDMETQLISGLALLRLDDLAGAAQIYAHILAHPSLTGVMDNFATKQWLFLQAAVKHIDPPMPTALATNPQVF